LKSITYIRTTYLTAQDRNTPTIELTLCLSRVYSFTQSKTPLAYLFSYLNLFINSRNKWVQWAVQLYARKTLKIAIIDTDIDKDHPDLQSELLLDYEPYTNNSFSCNPFHGHGTTVASFATAETTEIGGSPNGQLASVGFNTKFIFYHAWGIGPSVYLQKAHHASLVMGADVLTSSAGGWRCHGGPDPIEEAAVKEILDNGTVIVMAAGNGETGTHCDNGSDGIHDPWYPLHPIYDDRIIIVTGTDKNDKHNIGTNGNEHSHSHFPAVDICAPGWGMMGAVPANCGSNEWPYYGTCNGTSFATPIVAGVCALLKSVDNELGPGEIQQILKTTTDPVSDADDYVGLIGAGRVNAFKALNEAIECTPYIVENDEVWNEERAFYCDVFVEPGVELTINANVSFGQSSSMIVKPSARLILNNCELESIDNKNWQGIQVLGDPNESQEADNNGNYTQGYLKLNNATIKNAEIAVYVGKLGNYYTFDGGIVIANNSHFINNRSAVHLPTYKNMVTVGPYTFEMNNRSRFTDCTFEINEDILFDVDDFSAMVRLISVKGISFKNCDFYNTTGFQENGNVAIESADATFTVRGKCVSNMYPCNDYDPSTFEGFWCGIKSYNPSSDHSKTFSVRNAEFINNGVGIRAHYVDNILAVDNYFEIGENIYEQQTCEDAPGLGIDLIFSTGFALEDNYFQKYPNAPEGIYTGISIDNSDDQNEIYKNEFNNLSYANYADRKNWSQNDRWKGLSYICNENTNNYADFYVADDPGDMGIQSLQGSGSLAAGNTFSANNATWHFYNGGDHLVGYHFLNSTNQEPTLLHQVITSQVNNQNTCPSHFGGNIDKNILMSNQEFSDAEEEYYENYNNFSNVKSLYEDLTDGGNTSGTRMEIATAQPEDMWELRAQLLGDSPHLSMEILKEAADRTDVFSEAALFDILAANPDELKKEELMQYLSDKANPLPEYMIEVLRSVAMGTTYKTALQQQMALYSNQYTRAANDIIRSILHDEYVDHELLRNWLDNKGGLSSDLQIISSFMAENNFEDAMSLANMLPQLYEMQGEELTEHGYYMDILALYESLHQNNRSIEQLNNQETAMLTAIAQESNDLAGIQAKSILEYTTGATFINCPNYTDAQAAYKSSPLTDDFLADIHGLSIEAKPNPAKTWAAFSYTLPENEAIATITIFDAMGKMVAELQANGVQGQVLWDTRSMKSGVYTYTIQTTSYSKSGKIVVTK
jgi:hypothetical protein